MNQILKTRCAIYISIAKNLDSDQTMNSYNLQEISCMEYIKDQAPEGWIFSKVYCDYEDEKLTHLTKMKTDIKNKKINCVVVYSIDKISSNIHSLSQNWSFIKDHKATLVPVTSIHHIGYCGDLSDSEFIHFSNFESNVLHLKRNNEFVL